MIRLLYLIVAILFLSYELHSQEILDNVAQYRAEYLYQFKKDSTRAGYYKDTYFLDICTSGHSYFYSRANLYRDSVSQALLENGYHWMDVHERIRALPRGLHWCLDKRFVERKYHYINRLTASFYRAVENLDVPQWNLLKDTLTVGGWLCRKATAVIAGREWSVWYTPQIPINDGPWLLWGLPGLIIYATDSHGYFRFQCESVGQLAEPYMVLLPSENHHVKAMDICSLIKAECLAETDFEKFELTYSGAISVSSSIPPPKRHYIPLYLVK